MRLVLKGEKFLRKCLPIIFVLITLPLFSQISYFNLYRPYQTTLCCPVSIYGLGIETNYFLVDSNTARLDIPISLYWGMVDSLEIGFKVSAMSINSGSNSEKGVSDIIVGTKYNFLSPAKKKLYEENKSYDLSAFPDVSGEFCFSLPTGDFKKGLGTGAVGIILNWLLEKEIQLRSGNKFNSFFGVGYRINTTNSDSYKYGNELFFNVGSYFRLKEKYILSCGFRGISHDNDEYYSNTITDSRYTENYIFGGLSYDLGVYQQFFSAISIGLDSKSNILIFNIGMNY